MANITTETIDGTKFYTAIYRGTEYTLSANGIDGWFVATRRLSLAGRGLGNGKVYDTLADVAAGCKAFGDEAALINLVFGVEPTPAAAPAPAVQTVIVSPIDLAVGDRVIYHGATVEVMRINESECLVDGGIRVAACISRRVGDDCGSIPPSWFETAKSMRDRGCPWIENLPEGRYINVQGNAHARVAKIVG